MSEQTSTENTAKNQVVIVPTSLVWIHYGLCGICALLGVTSVLTLTLPGLLFFVLVPFFLRTARCMKKGIVADYDRRTLFIPCHPGTYDSGFELKRWLHEFTHGIEIPFDSIKSIEGEDYMERSIDSKGNLNSSLRLTVCILTDFGSVRVGRNSTNEWYRDVVTFPKDIITKLYHILSEILEKSKSGSEVSEKNETTASENEKTESNVSKKKGLDEDTEEELKKLKALFDEGLVDENEFKAKKSKLLGL